MSFHFLVAVDANNAVRLENISFIRVVFQGCRKIDDNVLRPPTA